MATFPAGVFTFLFTTWSMTWQLHCQFFCLFYAINIAANVLISESKVWEFSSCHDQNFWNVPATSEYFRQFSEDFWTLLKMSEDVLTTFELFWIYLKNDHFCALWYFLCTKSILSTFWNIFREIELNCPYKSYAKKNSLKLVNLAWEIVLDAWDRCLQSAALRLTHNG